MTSSQWHAHTMVDQGFKFELNLVVQLLLALVVTAGNHERLVIFVQLIWKKKHQ